MPCFPQCEKKCVWGDCNVPVRLLSFFCMYHGNGLRYLLYHISYRVRIQDSVAVKMVVSNDLVVQDFYFQVHLILLLSVNKQYNVSISYSLFYMLPTIQLRFKCKQALLQLSICLYFSHHHDQTSIVGPTQWPWILHQLYAVRVVVPLGILKSRDATFSTVGSSDDIKTIVPMSSIMYISVMK